jgi:hypothetical protein
LPVNFRSILPVTNEIIRDKSRITDSGQENKNTRYMSKSRSC